MPKKVKKPDLDETLRSPSLALNIVNKYLRWILLLLIGIILFFGYTYVIQVKINELLVVANQSLPAKQKVLSDLRAIKEELDSVVVEFSVLKKNKKAYIDKFEQILPSRSDFGDLFTMLDDVTRKAGFTMTSINIAQGSTTKQAPSAFQEVSKDGKPVQPEELSSIKRLTIHMAVDGGTYESFKGYLNLLQRNIRMLDVQSLSLDGASYIPDKDGKLPTPHYDIELITYYRSYGD